MGRPRLGFGEWGHVRVTEAAAGTFRARAQYRGSDGVTRPVEATGPTRAAAERRLTTRLRENATAGSGDLTGHSTVAEAMERHLSRIERRVEAGERSPNTLRTYRQQWRKHLEPAVSGWRLAEVTVARAEDTLDEIARRTSPDIASCCRVLLSGAMQLAVRYRAVPANPIRDVERHPGRRRADPVALTPAEVADALLKLAADRHALRADLPDLVLWMLATSERIGNALAATWERIDLDAATADLGPNVIRVRGEGVRVMTPENSKRRRRLVGLPPTAIRMLRTRREALGTSSTGLVFPNSTGTGPRDPSHTGETIKAALRRAGHANMTSHVLRKTVATALDEARLTPNDIAGQLGHSDTVTQRRYIAPRVNLGNVAAIEALLTRPGDVVDLADRRRA